MAPLQAFRRALTRLRVVRFLFGWVRRRRFAGSVFGVVVPFVGAGHLAVDSDARDPLVARWLRGVLLRVLAALPDGTLRVAVRLSGRRSVRSAP